MAQELEVVAADHRDAALDEADHRVAERRGLPRLGGNAFVAIERHRDLAVARTPPPPVGSLHHQPQAPAPGACQPCVGRHGAPSRAAPESDERLDAPGKIVVDGNERGERTSRGGAWEDQDLRGRGLRAEGVSSSVGFANVAKALKWPGRPGSQHVGTGHEDEDGRIRGG